MTTLSTPHGAGAFRLSLLGSTDGSVSVEFAHYSLTPDGARELARLLSSAADSADYYAGRGHERHVNLTADCPLCVAEAGHQLDRLEDVDDVPLRLIGGRYAVPVDGGAS